MVFPIVNSRMEIYLIIWGEQVYATFLHIFSRINTFICTKGNLSRVLGRNGWVGRVLSDMVDRGYFGVVCGNNKIKLDLSKEMCIIPLP